MGDPSCEEVCKFILQGGSSSILVNLDEAQKCGGLADVVTMFGNLLHTNLKVYFVVTGLKFINTYKSLI